MKCPRRDCLVLLFAIFTSGLSEKSSFRGQLRKMVNVGGTSASFLELERAKSGNNASGRWLQTYPLENRVPIVEFPKLVKAYPLDDVPAGAVIPNKLLLNYGETMGEMLAHRTLNQKDYENGTRLIPAIEKTVDLMPGAELIFADDHKCKDYLRRAHYPELVKFYNQQGEGKHKSTICRFVMLYVEGGYYFDNDVDLLQDVRKMDVKGASFLSVTEFPWHGKYNKVSQAFIAATAQHPVVRLMLDAFLEMSHKSPQPGSKRLDIAKFIPDLAGPALMAWLNLSDQKKFDATTRLQTYTPPGHPERRAFLLKETNQFDEYNVTSPHPQGKWRCEFFIADDHEALAWEHAPGSSKQC